MSWLSDRERFPNTGASVNPASAWASILLSLAGALLMFYGMEDMTWGFSYAFTIGVILIVIAAVIVFKYLHRKQNSHQLEIKRENEDGDDTYFELAADIAKDISAFYHSLREDDDFMLFLKECVHIEGDDSDADLKLKASIMMDLKKCHIHRKNPTPLPTNQTTTGQVAQI